MPPLPHHKALALKEEGWPQPTQEDFSNDLWFEETEAHGEYVMWPEQQCRGQDKAYSPSLEELIEGCKIRIKGKRVRLEMNVDEFNEGYSYSAELTTEEDLGHHVEVRTVARQESDASLKEALSDLWLSLPPELRSK